MDHFSMAGRTAMVTGGARGLGLEMARGLARNGADLVITGRTSQPLEIAAATLAREFSVNVEFHVSDLADPDQAKQLATCMNERETPIDILVNNAGASSTQDTSEVELAEWDRLLSLMLTAPMILAQGVVPRMRARGWGRIVHISSIQGLGSSRHKSSYTAAKTGFIGLMRAQACDLGGDGITVNCIAPGLFLTELSTTTYSEAQLGSISDRTLLGRPGQAHEIVGPLLLLASDAGAYITGETLVVDGGVMARSV